MNPRYLIGFDLPKLKKDFFDLIVVGSGIAALSLVAKVPPNLKVLVLTKGKPEESSTYYAQGGIAAAISPADQPKFHLEDTLEAGNGLCDLSAVEILVNEGPSRVEDLIEWGVEFDRKNGDLVLGREGGHSLARIVHHGDSTGREIERVLLKKVETLPNLDFRAGEFAIDLLTQESHCVGVIAFDEKESLKAYLAPHVVLATGGAGALYQSTTNPEIATGDGVAMAFRAGAYLADLEFFQFHPTALNTLENPRFLITESLRGAGAYLVDSKGRRFMKGIHPLAELAPRYVVVKEMVKIIEEGEKIFIDARHIATSELKQNFPGIFNHCLKLGLDLSKDLIPICPAAHFFIGGVRTDLKGRTNLSGLLACGEVAATYVHGSNRLASNSLLESLVFSQRIATFLSEEKPLISKTDLTNLCLSTSNLKGHAGQSVEAIQALMTEKVGILRRGDDLKEALEAFESMKRQSIKVESRKSGEFANLLTVAELVARAAWRREESRGVHIREDFPEKDERWRKHILVWRGEDGQVQLGYD
jgi:L-aspartate oxidase